MARTPTIFCPVCRFFEPCGADDWSRRLDMFQCYRDAHIVDIETQRAHLARLAEVEGVSVPPDFLPRILDLVRATQGEVARPLEYSVTWDEQEQHWYRFSVVYWDLRPDSQRRDLDHALATARLFGAVGEGNVREAVFEAMGAGTIYQVLYGVDLRHSGSRQKIYLRLGRGEIPWKENFIRALVPGFSRELAIHSLDILRLIGIDLREADRAPGVKLYYMPGQVPWERAAAMSGRHPFLLSIEKRCPDLREMMLIQRLEADRPVEKRLDEVELHMLRNLLSLADLWRFLEEQGTPFPMGRFLGFYRTALVVPTSVTFPARSLDKMNLYYLLVRSLRAS
ncbi:MAG: hypothetical protein ABIK09_10550 [Pseudomonadota bacterium]